MSKITLVSLKYRTKSNDEKKWIRLGAKEDEKRPKEAKRHHGGAIMM